ncbi:DUF3090 domain-containing protein [Tenggerimyces flavus]|uniref:DUF3090 domain-containing protein n=1 Tax=Tenggerimyces flavus TaxID=1708749 RepID=A0ABV7Y4V7_9ACTN|nr:DUF3090 domain-containing protein [Tenggerimyces flavus]MBM7788308.1 putative repeat protein (TIGR03847 family) [Tenggerimyces flavus]
MARVVHLHEMPERFVAGTVGAPGQRSFYLQARSSDQITTVALEKEQVSILAERVDAMLDEVLRLTGGKAVIPAIVPTDLDDDKPLEQPIIEEFRVGTLRLAWDSDTEKVVIEAYEVTEEESDPPPPVEEDPDAEGPETLVVRITGAQARAFVRRSLALISQGRPPCPFCGGPLDPDGHLCPRQNGYRRTEL